MMHGVVAADTCTVPKEMCVSGEKSLINTHSCALGDEVVKIFGMVDVFPLKFWCMMISPRSEIMALENLGAPTCFLSKEPQWCILCCHSKLIAHVWRRSLNDACCLWENLAVPFMFSKRQSLRLNDVFYGPHDPLRCSPCMESFLVASFWAKSGELLSKFRTCGWSRWETHVWRRRKYSAS